MTTYEEEEVKWAYAFDFLWTKLIAMRYGKDERMSEGNIPDIFKGCAGYGDDEDCWEDWVISFIDASKEKNTVNFPTKGSPEDEQESW